jgi:lipoate-protein ligase A
MQSIDARLIPYKSLSGFHNMGIDEYLISYYKKTKIPVLRIYGWSNSAITLGRYQRAECLDTEACREDHVDVVRRITGGGAILHRNEVTYSLTCSEGDVGGGHLSVKQSFERLNSFIITLYREFGLEAMYAKEEPAEGKPDAYSPFCFSGREDYDILINEKKIGGNAQRRIKDVIFQHGSIPLSLNNYEIQKYFRGSIDFTKFTSLYEALHRDVAFPEVAQVLADSCTKTFDFKLFVEELSAPEIQIINSMIEDKYFRDRWNLESG